MENNNYAPKYCVWELTLKCNMNCIHCGSKAGEARENELTLDECYRVCEELIELGCEQLTFIGGEIFLYKSWEKVAKKLTDNGVVVNLITNGSLMGDKQIREIKHAGLANVGISVDGMKESHNKIRNVKTSFDKVLKAFDKLNSENIPIAAVTTLMNYNINDIEEMYELLSENNIGIWQLQIATPMGNMTSQKDYLLDPLKIPHITNFIRSNRHNGKMRLYAGDDIGYYDENEMYIRNKPGTLCAWSGCQAGLTVIGIDSAGNVKGCESIYSEELIEGNLREETLREIWFKEGNFAYNRNFDTAQLTGNCAGCDKGSICKGGCRGICYFNSEGNFFENNYCLYNGVN